MRPLDEPIENTITFSMSRKMDTSGRGPSLPSPLKSCQDEKAVKYTIPGMPCFHKISSFPCLFPLASCCHVFLCHECGARASRVHSVRARHAPISVSEAALSSHVLQVFSLSKIQNSNSNVQKMDSPKRQKSNSPFQKRQNAKIQSSQVQGGRPELVLAVPEDFESGLRTAPRLLLIRPPRPLLPDALGESARRFR